MRLSLSMLFVAFALSAVHADGPGDYLKQHKLKERLEVRVLQGGFAGFTGTYYAIETDGAWSTGSVLPNDKVGEAKARGKLTAEQLTGLAKDLAKYDLATLPNYGKPEVNPKVVRITFGKTASELQPGPGKGTAAEDKAIRARYAGIATAVKALCKETK